MAGDLPDEVLPPEVRKVDADARPIMFMVITKPGWSSQQLSDYVDRNIVDRFFVDQGRAQVFIGARRGRRCASGCSPKSWQHSR